MYYHFSRPFLEDRKVSFGNGLFCLNENFIKISLFDVY